MNYDQFKSQINSLDHTPVILLEGKRNVIETEKNLLSVLGEKLATDLPHCIFRSGNATGSDELFMSGAAKINSENLEFVLPYSSHRKKARFPESKYYAIDEIVISNEVFNSILNATPKYKAIIKAYSSGQNNKLTAKAWYLIRDAVKVFGYEPVMEKADFAIFYDDINEPQSGGTGHTIRVCLDQDVPAINQNTWFDWVRGIL